MIQHARGRAALSIEYCIILVIPVRLQRDDFRTTNIGRVARLCFLFFFFSFHGTRIAYKNYYVAFTGQSSQDFGNKPARRFSRNLCFQSCRRRGPV